MIKLTPLAAEKIRLLSQQQGAKVPLLRMVVEPGRCSGYQYGMALAAQAAEDDTVIETQGILVAIAAAGLPLLEGAEVDYVESLMQTGFIVHNPNAASTCTCGQSFDAASKAEAFPSLH